MAVVDARGPLTSRTGRCIGLEGNEESITIITYRECTRCSRAFPMDETQPPYPEMRGPPQ